MTSAEPVGVGAATEGPWPTTAHLDWGNILGYHVRCDLCPAVELLCAATGTAISGDLLSRGLHWALTHPCSGVAR